MSDTCAYCGEPIEYPVKRIIWVNHQMKGEVFCSEACADDRQKGAEG